MDPLAACRAREPAALLLRCPSLWLLCTTRLSCSLGRRCCTQPAFAAAPESAQARPAGRLRAAVNRWKTTRGRPCWHCFNAWWALKARQSTHSPVCLRCSPPPPSPPSPPPPSPPPPSPRQVLLPSPSAHAIHCFRPSAPSQQLLRTLDSQLLGYCMGAWRTSRFSFPLSHGQRPAAPHKGQPLCCHAQPAPSEPAATQPQVNAKTLPHLSNAAASCTEAAAPKIDKHCPLASLLSLTSLLHSCTSADAALPLPALLPQAPPGQRPSLHLHY